MPRREPAGLPVRMDTVAVLLTTRRQINIAIEVMRQECEQADSKLSMKRAG